MNQKNSKNNFPRHIAVRVLTRVLSDRQPLDEALSGVSGEVSPSSLAWLQDVTSGTLRWKGRLDSILDSIAIKKKPSGWLRKILLIAAYQIVVQDRSPAAAVVSETVSEVKSKEGEAPSKFANALLRKVVEHAAQWKDQKLDSRMDERMAAQWASLPEWLWKKIAHQRGIEWAQSYAQASLDRPKLWIRARSEAWKPEWAKAGSVPLSWEGVSGGAVPELAGFGEGEFIVQDISSQFLISKVTEEIRHQKKDQRLSALDICAAPGGKSVGLAWNGFQVTATDRTSKRVPLLQQTVERAAPDIKVIPWDSWQKESPPDLIWVDAPCTGTGILRRHPDVRWLREERDLVSLTATQKELLQLAWSSLKPGGFLVYSVCSILKEEGSGAIQNSGLNSFVLKEWFLSPQEFPSGDGFWAAFLQKPEEGAGS